MNISFFQIMYEWRPCLILKILKINNNTQLCTHTHTHALNIDKNKINHLFRHSFTTIM